MTTDINLPCDVCGLDGARRESRDVRFTDDADSFASMEIDLCEACERDLDEQSWDLYVTMDGDTITEIDAR